MSHWSRVKRTVDPTAEPVTLAEMKAHLRVEDNSDDDLITSLLVAAREFVETETVTQLMPATYQMVLDGFPGANGAIKLPRPPFKSS